MNRCFIIALLTVTLIVPQGCITVDDRVNASLTRQSVAPNKFQLIHHRDLNIEHIVYSPKRLPMEDFLARLTAGEFEASLRQIDPFYHPSSTDNDAIKELLKAGLIPVYLKVTNTGRTQKQISELNFLLHDSQNSFLPIRSDDLPTVIERFNGAALGANVANVAIIVGVSILLIAAVSSGKSKIPNLSGGGNGGGGSGKGSTKKRRVINPLTKTTIIDYTELLFGDVQLAAGESREGLIFFRSNERPSWSDLQLSLQRD